MHFSFAWHGCPRCGAGHCPGCTHLPEFGRVESLLAFRGKAAEIVHSAKYQQWSPAILLLEALLVSALRVTLARIIREEDISHVFFAPLRRNRLLEGTWHPLLLIDHALESLPSPHVTKVFSGTDQKQSQASTPRADRLRHPSRAGRIRFSTLPRHAVRALFVDDILTTGSSLRNLHAAATQTCTLESATVFTIFRTPGSNQLT